MARQALHELDQLDRDAPASRVAIDVAGLEQVISR
jgi:hypothetical protein